MRQAIWTLVWSAALAAGPAAAAGTPESAALGAESALRDAGQLMQSRIAALGAARRARASEAGSRRERDAFRDALSARIKDWGESLAQGLAGDVSGVVHELRSVQDTSDYRSCNGEDYGRSRDAQSDKVEACFRVAQEMEDVLARFSRRLARRSYDGSEQDLEDYIAAIPQPERREFARKVKGDLRDKYADYVARIDVFTGRVADDVRSCSGRTYAMDCAFEQAISFYGYDLPDYAREQRRLFKRDVEEALKAIAAR